MSVRASRRSVFVRRVRLAYMGANIRIRDNDLMPELFDVTRDPFTFWAGLEQNARRAVRREHRGQAIARRRNAPFFKGAVIVAMHSWVSRL